MTAKDASAVGRRAYSDDEACHIYELARFHLENGNMVQAEVLLAGLCEVRSDFGPAWLGQCYIHLMKQDIDKALRCARSARKCSPESVEAILFEITALISAHDLNSAGTLLGEVNDMVENGEIGNPNFVRFFKAQLARYQAAR